MTPRCILRMVSLLILCLPLHAIERASQVELFHGIAEGNYLIGDLNGAASSVEQVLRIDPGYLPALKLKARVLLDQGDAKASLKVVEYASLRAPKDIELQLLKALLFGHLEQRDDAIEIIHGVLASPEITSEEAQNANQLLGLLRMAEGNWDAAADAFRANVLANPESAKTSLTLASEAYLEKAMSAIEQKEIDAALASVDAALELTANHGGEDAFKERTALQLTRVRILSRSGRLDQAIADLQTITGQQADNLEATIMLASLYATLDRWDSLKGIIAPIQAEPALADIALYLDGRLALSQERVGTARAKFEDGLELTKGSQSTLRPSFHFYRGICLGRLDRADEAEAEITKAIDLGFRPDSVDEAILAGEVLLRTGAIEQAIPILEAVALNRLDASTKLWNLLGRAHRANGNPALALSAFNASLKVNPRQVNALGLRGSLLRQLNDLEGAAIDYENALSLDPENRQLPYALGLVYFQLGLLPEAKAQVGLSAEAAPNNPGIQLLHALLDYAINDLAMTSPGLLRYHGLVQEAPNATALYLSYAISAPVDHAGAIETLRKAAADHPSESVKKYYAYCTGQATRKEILDHAGFAETPEQARKQICAAAYWMAQHHRNQPDSSTYRELLDIAVQFGNPDLPEYQFAQWATSKSD
ncbi:MAG: tetratricopeptide repeat protein [Verrucomicrobiota bacterium]